jgi:hypothetical protein
VSAAPPLGCRDCRGTGWLDCEVVGTDAIGIPLRYDVLVRCECSRGAEYKAATFSQHREALLPRGLFLKRREIASPDPERMATWRSRAAATLEAGRRADLQRGPPDDERGRWSADGDDPPEDAW